MLFVKPDYWIIVDDFASSSAHTYQQIWQGTYDVRNASTALQTIAEARLVVMQGETEGVRCTPHRLHDTESIWFERAPASAWKYVTLIAPSPAGAPLAATIHPEVGVACAAYVVHRADAKDHFVVGRGDPWAVGSTTSDARVAAWTMEGRTQRAVLVLNMCEWKSATFSLHSSKPISVEAVSGKEGRWTFRRAGGMADSVRVRGDGGVERTLDFSLGDEQTLSLEER